MYFDDYYSIVYGHYLVHWFLLLSHSDRVLPQRGFSANLYATDIRAYGGFTVTEGGSTQKELRLIPVPGSISATI